MSIIERLHANLQPRGSEPVVVLRPNCGYIAVDEDFITACINEVAKIEIKVKLGDKPSNLETLAFMLLCDSAGIDTKTEQR
jgi:hypothetical protein